MADQPAKAEWWSSSSSFCSEVGLALGGFLGSSAFAFLVSRSSGSCDAEALCEKSTCLIQNSYVRPYKFI